MILTVCAKFIEVSSSCIFIYIMFLFIKLLLEECKILHYGGTVTDICIAHALHLSLILNHLSQLDCIVSLDSYILADAVQLGIASLRRDTNLNSLLIKFTQNLHDICICAQFNILTIEILCLRIGFEVVREEHGARILHLTFLWIEEHIREEDWVIFDVSASQVCQPADIVEC